MGIPTLYSILKKEKLITLLKKSDVNVEHLLINVNSIIHAIGVELCEELNIIVSYSHRGLDILRMSKIINFDDLSDIFTKEDYVNNSHDWLRECIYKLKKDKMLFGKAIIKKFEKYFSKIIKNNVNVSNIKHINLFLHSDYDHAKKPSVENRIKLDAYLNKKMEKYENSSFYWHDITQILYYPEYKNLLDTFFATFDLSVIFPNLYKHEISFSCDLKIMEVFRTIKCPVMIIDPDSTIFMTTGILAHYIQNGNVFFMRYMGDYLSKDHRRNENPYTLFKLSDIENNMGKNLTHLQWINFYYSLVIFSNDYFPSSSTILLERWHSTYFSKIFAFLKNAHFISDKYKFSLDQFIKFIKQLFSDISEKDMTWDSEMSIRYKNYNMIQYVIGALDEEEFINKCANLESKYEFFTNKYKGTRTLTITECDVLFYNIDENLLSGILRLVDKDDIRLYGDYINKRNIFYAFMFVLCNYGKKGVLDRKIENNMFNDSDKNFDIPKLNLKLISSRENIFETTNYMETFLRYANLQHPDIVNKIENDINPDKYYEHFFTSKKNALKEYCTGLYYVFHEYLGKYVTNDKNKYSWSYPFYRTPYLNDLIDYKIDITTFKINKDDKINPLDIIKKIDMDITFDSHFCKHFTQTRIIPKKEDDDIDDLLKSYHKN